MKSILSSLRFGIALALLIIIFTTSATAWENDLDVNDLISENGAQYGGTFIVADGSGGYYVVWEDSRLIGTYQFFAQRLDTDGNALWPADDVLVMRSFEQIYDVKVLTGDDGDLYVGMLTTEEISREIVQ